MLSPQQYAAPAVVTPQGEEAPLGSTAANVSPPDTATGVVLLIWVPLPSWPPPLAPQQYAAPAGVTPQVTPPPALTAANVSAAMLKLLLLAPARVVADAVRVYPVPGLLMLTFAKVATPFTAATVLVPARVPLAGLVPIATVMLVVAVVTVLPWASWTATCMAGVIPAPAAALLGCTAKMSFAAGPTPVGATGPLLLPEHPPSATPQSTTPTQSPPRASTAARRWRFFLSCICLDTHMLCGVY